MKRVLVIDSNQESFESVARFLAQDGHTVQNSRDFESALHQLKAWKPHLILIDQDSMQGQPFGIVPKIRLLTQDEFTPVAYVVSSLDVQEVTQGFDLGADDWLCKPLSQAGVIQRVRTLFRLKDVQDALKRAHQRIEEVISTDELTGLLSMRAAYKRADEELSRARRIKKPVSTVLLNLDHFSGVNQTYGFAVGSHVLQEIALRLKKCLRSVDLIARVGADEFFILLHETDLSGAEFVAERLRDAVQADSFRSQKHLFNLTATLGVAGLAPNQAAQKMSDLFQLTMEALKAAKSNGSNRIEVYSFT